jgi:hypothetical protein
LAIALDAPAASPAAGAGDAPQPLTGIPRIHQDVRVRAR